MSSPRGVIERSPQTLPVPLGDMAPAHAPSPRRGALRSKRNGWLTGASALAMGVAGLVLLATAPGTSVYVAGGRLHVGATTLRLVSETPGASLYSGDAVYQLTVSAGGEVSARARWRDGGRVVSADCAQTLPGGVPTVRCVYTSGSPASTDVFDARTGVWHRRYDDGVGADIAVPPGGVAVPVAFPIGH
ncbi:MAG: hypothetical protein ACYDAC_08260 [Candidatus Dormibacteria bacterium]